MKEKVFYISGQLDLVDKFVLFRMRARISSLSLRGHNKTIG